MRKHILALDPGKTTGWAKINTETMEFTAGQTTFMETGTMLMQVAAKEDRDEWSVVSEAFIITTQTAKNTQATWSLELIGITRFVSEAYLAEPLVLQAPSAAKRFSSDARLRAMGWWSPGQGHANDAARHLMLYMVSRKWMDDRLISA